MKKEIKKLIKVLMMLVLIVNVMMINAFALTSTVLTLESSSENVPLNTEFTITVKASNTRDTIGLTSVEGTLAYDETILNTLTPTNVQGLNGWNATYDALTKKVTATIKQGTLKQEAPIFKIVFKTKASQSIKPNPLPGTPSTPTVPQNPGTLTPNPQVQPQLQPQVQPQVQTPSASSNGQIKIELKGIKVSNGVQTVPVADRTKTVNMQTGTVKPPVQTPTPIVPPKQEEKPNKTPHAGIEDSPVIILGALAIVAAVSFVGYKKIATK